MALAIDASTPARATASSTTVTSAAFTPPVGALLVVCTSGTGGSQANPTLTVSTVTGSTSAWTQLNRATRTTTGGTTSNDGLAAVHYATVTSSVSTTVRSVQTTGSSPTSILVYVITGQDSTTPIGNSSIGRSLSNILTTTAFNTTANDVFVGCSFSEWDCPTSTAPTTTDMTTRKDIYVHSALHGGSGFDTYTTSGTSAAFVLDGDGTVALNYMYVVFEVYPPAGTPGNVTATVMTATATDVTPTVSAAATIAATLMTATATDITPTVTAGATVAAALMTATATAPAPAVSNGAGLTFTAGTSYEGTASETSVVVTLPSGLASGDYTIIVASSNSSSGGITTPAGWTDILANTNSVNGSTSDHHAIFYRKWQSGDTDPTVTLTSGRFCATPIRVQGADPTTFVDVAATVTQSAAAAATQFAPTITPTSEWLVCTFNGRDNNSNIYQTPYTALSASMTKIAEASAKSTSTNAGHCIAFEQVTSGAATGTRQVNPAFAVDGGMGVSFSLNAASASVAGNVAAVTATATATALAPVVTGDTTTAATLATATAAAAVPVVTAAATVLAVRGQSTAAAPSPVVTAAGTVTATLATATATMQAPTAGVSPVVLAVRAQATALAPVPVVTAAATIQAVCATATALAPAPSVSAAAGANVAALAATATAQAIAPTVTSASNIAATCGTATAGAQAPTVSGAATIQAVRAQATTTAAAPVVTSAATVVAPVATATATALAPSVGTGTGVVAPAATALATMLAPTVSVPVGVQSVTATATAQAGIPVVSAAAVVAAVRATATVLALPPALTAAGLVMAPSATASGTFRAPTVSAGATKVAVLATALARMWAPHVTAIDGSDIVLVGEPLSGRWARTELPVKYSVQEQADRFVATYVPLENEYAVQPLTDRFVGGLNQGEPMSVEVLVSAGAVKFVGGTVTETAGLDISAATFEMSLGSATNPGTWVAPDVSQAGTTTASRVLKLKVSDTLPAGIVVPGTYWCWARVTATPEVEPVRLQGPITVR